MRTVIWAAVSSKPQAEDKDSIPTQIEAARELIAREGWQEVQTLTIPGHSRNYLFLHDIAEDVPQYRDLMALARSGSIDILICRSRDRLGRSDALIAQLEGYLRAHGCQVYSLEMPTPLVDPEHLRTDRAGIWSAAVERARAEDEMAQLRARHTFGMKARIRKGYHASRPPFGYRKGDDGIGQVYEPEAALVRLMYAWLLQGDALADIHRKLGEYTSRPKHPAVIKYILSNPFYCGLTTYSRMETTSRAKDREEWIEADGLHEPIVDRATWEAVQKELQRRLDARAPKVTYPLTGICYCGKCGLPMRGSVGTGRGKSYRYYICARGTCDRNSYRADVLEQKVLDWCRQWRDDPEALQSMIDEGLAAADRLQADEAEQKQAALEQKRTSLDRWTMDYELGLLSREEYYQHKARLADEVARLEKAVARAERERREPERAGEVVEVVTQGRNWREKEMAKLVRTQLASIGMRITIEDNEAVVSLAP